MEEDMHQMDRDTAQLRRTGADLSKFLVPMWRATLQQRVAVGGEGAVSVSQEQSGQGPSLAASSQDEAMGGSDTARQFAWAKTTEFFQAELRRLRRKFRGAVLE